MTRPAMTEPVIEPPGSEPEPAGPRPEPPAPLWLRLLGLTVAVAGALVVSLVCAFLTPYRIGSVLVPVSLVLVAGGLTAVTRFAHAVTEHVPMSLIPGLAWLVLTLVLNNRTSEGDLVLLSSNWVAVVYLLVGSVTIGVLAYRMIVPRPRRGTLSK